MILQGDYFHKGIVDQLVRCKSTISLLSCSALGCPASGRRTGNRACLFLGGGSFGVSLCFSAIFFGPLIMMSVLVFQIILVLEEFWTFRDSGDVHVQDNFVMAIYPNTHYNLTQKHVEYVKQKEWLDAMTPVRWGWLHPTRWILVASGSYKAFEYPSFADQFWSWKVGTLVDGSWWIFSGVLVLVPHVCHDVSGNLDRPRLQMFSFNIARTSKQVAAINA